MKLLLLLVATLSFAREEISVGSKKFTESVVLGELVRLSLENSGQKAIHRAELGGTRILWNALLAGDIDVYPEYTGTIEEELLQKKTRDFEELRSELARMGVGVTAPLGFNNTYAIGMKKDRAVALGIRSISDLKHHPDLKIGWSEEFRKRQDGWPGLKARYGLPHRLVRGLDHDIAYRALESGDIEVIDLYSTDAEIAYYDLLILEDDLSYFPKYEALFLYRLETAARIPLLRNALEAFSGKIPEAAMIALNHEAKIGRKPSGEVAARFLREKFAIQASHEAAGRVERLLVRSGEHLKMVLISLALAILAAVPLGVLAAKRGRLGQGILWLVGAIQTVPALALLVILIKPLNLLGLSGIGDTPAFIALFLYSLLPIVRSTHSGFHQIPPALRETAEVLGLSGTTQLFRVEFPLALPSILSGIKTSAVLNVGFATLGALVGAGGYGQPILTGIRLDDYSLILEGALPAAALALIVQQGFDYAERFLVSPGLKK